MRSARRSWRPSPTPSCRSSTLVLVVLPVVASPAVLLAASLVQAALLVASLARVVRTVLQLRRLTKYSDINVCCVRHTLMTAMLGSG